MSSRPVPDAVRPAAPIAQHACPQLPGAHRYVVEPDSALLAYGAYVRVLPWRDTHAGQIGVVRRIWLDGGELLHCVRFSDGSRADYFSDELRLVPQWML